MQRRHATSNTPSFGQPSLSSHSVNFHRRSNPGNALSSITGSTKNQDRDRCFLFLIAIAILSVISFSYEFYTDTEPSKVHFGMDESYNIAHAIKMSSKTADATRAMLEQPSSFVDGEKMLKKRLQVLHDRQQKGIDVGVKHLTRWQGKDVPVWIPKDGKPLEFDDDIVDDETEEKSHSVPKKTEFAPQNGMQKDFPCPTEMVDGGASIYLEPSYGTHRMTQDAVFGLAEGYDLNTYVAFIETLRETGFSGDIVLSVSSPENMKPGVEDYLKKQENLVIYMMKWTCFNGKGESKATAGEGANLCQANGIYEHSDGSLADDPREPRPVATSRYELYWIWAMQYYQSSMIMLIDSRDTFFQSNPFTTIERSGNNIEETGGLLHFFGENHDAVSLQTSTYNLRWLKKAYGSKLDKIPNMLEQQVICSGSTMGEKIALEEYLRAMVAEFDSTKCVIKGCDQGFHNYLYYSKSLEGVAGIRKVVLHDQGKGVINNLGALREKSLREQNVLDDENHVLNWDGSISPVAHQFDRDDEMRIYMNNRKRELVAKVSK